MDMKLPSYPDRRCENSPNHAHYFIPVTGASEVWRCKYCWVAQWLPNNWPDCLTFHYAKARFGIDKAYQKALEHRPGTVRMLDKLEEIRLLRKVLPEKELMVAIAAIIKEGGKDE